MAGKFFGKKILRYGLVGIVAAMIHACTLLILTNIFSLWISNLLGFLAASLASYIGHALFTFRTETKGKYFARRWLLMQFISNTVISSLLPLLLGKWTGIWGRNLIFILTPTFINALIWFKAARFSALRRRNRIAQSTRIHADDLGLTKATNTAIIELAISGKLNSASIIINGNTVEEAIKTWKEKVNLPIFLHLCLTEGKAISESEKLSPIKNKRGALNSSFIKLLIVSILPKKLKFRRKIEKDLRLEIIAQINKFKEFTGQSFIGLDGHQHIHLIPIILDIILELSAIENITWIRTTSEPIPSNLPLKSWKNIIKSHGWLKWIILQLLNARAKPRIKKAAISTNSGFAGVLCSGHMTRDEILASISELKILTSSKNETESLILIHPAAPIEEKEQKEDLLDFPLSLKFLNSPWRLYEWNALSAIKNKPLNEVRELHEQNNEVEP